MPFIQNVSMSDIKFGHHLYEPDQTILIQIVDPGVEFPDPKFKFPAGIFQFEFLDAEDDSKFDEDFLFSESDAKSIANILRLALCGDVNVVVHCHAGLCRSGAVAEIGIMLGFKPTIRTRIPNLRVKRMLMKEFGWGYE